MFANISLANDETCRSASYYVIYINIAIFLELSAKLIHWKIYMLALALSHLVAEIILILLNVRIGMK